MRCIAVPNDYTRHHDFSKATMICSSLKDVTPALLQSLGAKGRRDAAEQID
jgi:hypothetical protein